MNPQGKNLEQSRVNNYLEAYNYVIDNMENLSDSNFKNKIRELFQKLEPNQKADIINKLNTIFNDSKKEYKSLIRDMYNLGNNFPENISQSEVIEIASKHINNFDTNTIEAYQLLNGLEDDGVIGYETYKAMKGILNVQKSRSPSEMKKPLDTEESIAQLETSKNTAKKSVEKVSDSLFGKNLKEIGVLAGDAQELAKKVLPNGEINKDTIRAFQEKHKLRSRDEKIGKETYIQLLLTQARKGYENDNYSLSELSRKNILNVLKNGKLDDPDVLKVVHFVEKFKSDKKDIIAKNLQYKKFISEFDKITGEFINSPEGQQAYKKAQKHYDSIYGTLKDPNLSPMEKAERIIKDPTLLMAGGILFLFGVIGGDTKYTNSFLKRIGWIFGGMMFGPAIWNKLGVSEMIDDAEKGVGNVGKYLSTWKDSEQYKTSKKSTMDFFQNLPETIKGINFSSLGDTWESVKSNISDQYETITSATFSYNNNLEGQAGYIKPKLLGELTATVFGDEKFMNTPKKDLANIKTKAELLGLLSKDGKTGLNAIKSVKVGETTYSLTDKNIASFMTNLQSQFEDDDNFVKDIFITTSIKTTIDSIFEDRQYFEDNKLNDEIKTDISNFTSSPDEDKKNAGEVLKRAILSGDNEELQKFDANSYGVSEVDKKALGEIKDRVLALRAGQEYLKNEIAKVEAIKVVETTDKNTETKQSIVEKITALETIENEFDKDKLNKVDSSSFETAVYNKKLKLYAKAKELEVSGAENTLSSLEKQKEVQNDLVEVGKLQLEGQVPGKTASLEDFESYLKDNNKVFNTAEKLAKKYKGETTGNEKEILDRANSILESKTTYKTKLEAKMKAIKLDVEKLTGELEKIKTTDVEEGEYINRFNALKEVYKKYSDLQTAENIEIASFQNQLNSLFGGTEAPKVELGFSTLKTAIKQKLDDLQSSFEINIDIKDKTYTDASAIVSQIKRKEEIIDSFNNSLNDGLFAKYRDKFSSLFDSNKNQEAKENEIVEVKKGLVKFYVEAIKGANTLEEIEPIKINFEISVVDQLDNIDKGPFKTAIENKVFGLFKGELGKAKNVNELKDIKNRYGVEETGITVFGYEITDENKYYKEFLEKTGVVFTYDNIDKFSDGTIVFPEYKAFLEKYKNIPYNKEEEYLWEYMGKAENMNQFISFLNLLTLQPSLFGKTDKELKTIQKEVLEVEKKTKEAFEEYVNETLF